MPKNPLLRQILTDANLAAALDWLQHAARDQDNSDVWHYRRDWESHIEHLRKRIYQQHFRFQVVREVETIEKGQRKFIEVRTAEDRLLIRAIYQILQPVVAAATPNECTHLAGRGGIKAAVRNTQAY